MNCGSIKSVKHDILFPLRRGEHDFSHIYARFCRRENRPRIFESRVCTPSYIFRVSLFYFGPSAKIVYCWRNVPAELCSPPSWPKLFYIPWYSRGNRGNAQPKCQPLEAGAYISVLSIVEIVSEDGFIVIELIII